jgi:hypothetical protein
MQNVYMPKSEIACLTFVTSIDDITIDVFVQIVRRMRLSFVYVRMLSAGSVGDPRKNVP